MFDGLRRWGGAGRRHRNGESCNGAGPGRARRGWGRRHHGGGPRPEAPPLDAPALAAPDASALPDRAPVDPRHGEARPDVPGPDRPGRGRRGGHSGGRGHGHGPRHGQGHGHGQGQPAFEGRSLNDLAPGDRCRIFALHGRGAIRHRLMDLGLVPNATVEVVRRAPLADPIEVRVADTFVTLRRAEAARIEVVHG
nr:FeoA family protein [Roseospira goensis]